MFLTSFSPSELAFYSLGIIVELWGFMFLFGKKRLESGFVKRNHIWIGIIIIITGWVISAPIGRT